MLVRPLRSTVRMPYRAVGMRHLLALVTRLSLTAKRQNYYIVHDH
jgi:hypothetical protein